MAAQSLTASHSALGALAGANACPGLRPRSVSLRPPMRPAGVAVRCSTYDPNTVDVAQMKPQGERVLVKLDDVSDKSAGGVLLPSSAVKYDAYLTGEIIATGPEAKVTAGQKVMFSDINAYEVALGSAPGKLCLVKDNDLMAVVS